MKVPAGLVCLLLVSAPPTLAGVLFVPADFATIQEALDVAGPGDTVEVAAGLYFEQIEFPTSGTVGSPIVLRPQEGATPILDGSGASAQNMVLINSKSYLRIEGFEIRNHLGVSDGSGIRVLGSARGVEIVGNVIHDIRGSDAMGITVYGNEPQPIEDLVIQGNQIFDCEPAHSEALVLNGNVRAFVIADNVVRDVNNIGIDMIGGELDIQPDPTLVAREGVVRGNVVERANSDYEGGYAGGIYVDGGRDIVIENNRVSESDIGLEIGAENNGLVTRDVIVRNNVFSFNEKAGIAVGGFEAAAGRANFNQIRGNTFFHNNTVGENGQGTHFPGGGIAELWFQYGEGNVVEGNLVVAGPENFLVASFDPGSVSAFEIDHNLYFSTDGVENGDFSWNGVAFTGLESWRAATGHDQLSVVGDPLLAEPLSGDFHLTALSPAIDAGNPAYLPDPVERDLDGEPRKAGNAVDLGADELGEVMIFSDGFESGDVGAWTGSIG